MGFTPITALLFPASPPVATLEELLDRFTRHAGVLQVVLLGADGLVIGRSQTGTADPDALAAAAPAVINAARTMAQGVDGGEMRTVVVELERWVGVLHPVSSEMIFAGIVELGSGFAPLLADFRREGRRLSQTL